MGSSLTQLGKGQEAQDKYALLKKNYPDSPYIVKDTPDNVTLSDIIAEQETPPHTDNKTVKPKEKK